MQPFKCECGYLLIEVKEASKIVNIEEGKTLHTPMMSVLQSKN